MNRLVLTAALLGASASANATERYYRMYDVEPATLDKRAVEAAARVARDCNYSMMSRIGPRPAEMARCNAAEEKLVALGAAGTRATLAALDDQQLGPGARNRMYDVLARGGDLALAEPLVRALEREEAAGLGNPRQMERMYLANVLTQLTYAAPKGTPAIQWRAWLGAHRGVTREALLQERATEVERQVAGGDVSEVIEAAEFLATQPATQARARKILQGLQARADLSYDQHRALRMTLDRIPAPSAPVAKQAAPQAKDGKVPRS